MMALLKITVALSTCCKLLRISKKGYSVDTVLNSVYSRDVPRLKRMTTCFSSVDIPAINIGALLSLPAANSLLRCMYNYVTTQAFLFPISHHTVAQIKTLHG